jgi:hypothetical protein
MKTPFSFILLCAALSLTIQSHKQNDAFSYTMDVYRNGERVGLLQTHKLQTGEKSQYELHSDVEINKLSNQYEKGKLLKASHLRMVNGIHQSNVQLKYENNKYVEADGKVVERAGTWIGTSILSLYHKEPVGLEGVYSETLGMWLTLKSIGPSIYQVNLPDAKRAIYHYENGELKKVVTDTKWGEIVFKR